jgi:pimeloyl-ACP methyl ester carboxylesterase
MRRFIPILLSAVALLAACAPNTPPPPPPGDEPAVRTITPPFVGKAQLGPPDLTDDGPGSLISVEPLNGAESLDEANAVYMRIVYRSTSRDGTPTEVSGAVAIPPGLPPKGGWPILALGQGTKGILPKCASSRYGSLPLNAYTMSVFLNEGFAIAVTDYQGTGLEGYHHPFLDSTTLGYNVIDSVRAARRVGADLSTQWVSFGHSMGGMAVWAAAEQASTYGQGLELMGTLSMAPAADMSGLADAAWNQTLTDDQRVTMVFVLQSLKWFHPEMDLDRFRSGATAQHWDELLDCLPPNFDDIAKARSLMTNADLRPRTLEDVDWLRARLEELALPKQKVESPMVVGYGTQDRLVNLEWFERALDRACAMGSHIQLQKGLGKGHADLDSGFGVPWLIARLSGEPAPNTCSGGT